MRPRQSAIASEGLHGPRSPVGTSMLLLLLMLNLAAWPAQASAEKPPLGDTHEQSPPAGEAHPSGHAYSVELEVDLPLLILPVTALLAWPLSDTFAPPHCAPLCDAAGLNAMDAVAAGLYDTTWASVSDVGVSVLLGSAVIVPFLDGAPIDALNDLVVIAQSVAWANASALTLAMATRRPRPYLYSEKAPIALRQAPKSAFSFASSHTAASFAASTALFQTLYRRHPESALPWVALAIGDAIALTVAIGRVQAGHHFPSDVIAGALIGTGIGLLIPALHSRDVQVAPMPVPDGVGLSLSGRL